MLSMTRNEAVTAIRRKLLEMVDEDHSMCQEAASRGIFCHGFQRLEDEQLRKRYSWLLRNNPEMSTEDLRDMANRWELARQIVNKVPISCDAQTIEKDTCHGWDSFDNDTIAQFYEELVGGKIQVIEEQLVKGIASYAERKDPGRR